MQQTEPELHLYAVAASTSALLLRHPLFIDRPLDFTDFVEIQEAFLIERKGLLERMIAEMKLHLLERAPQAPAKSLKTEREPALRVRSAPVEIVRPAGA